MDEPATPAQPQKELDVLRPALTGGLFLGALSSIPFLMLGCCLWIPAGGGVAAVLLNKQRPGGLKYGDGALVGVLSGLVGTVVSVLINIPLQIVMYTPAAVAQMRDQFNQWSTQFDIGPDFVKSMEPMFTPGFSLARLIMGAISFSIVGGLFAMIGGILAVGLLRRQDTRNARK